MSCSFAWVYICIMDGGHFSFPDADVDLGRIGLALRWLHIRKEAKHLMLHHGILWWAQGHRAHIHAGTLIRACFFFSFLMTSHKCITQFDEGSKLLHENGLLFLATSWIYQTNFHKCFSHSVVFVLSISELLASLFRILCLLVVHWFLFVLCLLGNLLALVSNFLWSFIIVPQGRKQIVLVLLKSLITIQTITLHMIQCWIREVKRNFGGVSRGEW